MIRTSTLAAFAGLALSASRAGAADPGTLVSFSWFTRGTTNADATAACLVPPPPVCEVFKSCDSSNGSYDEGGTSMTSVAIYPGAQSTCSATCNCCAFGGGSGHGSASAVCYITGTQTSADETRWSFDDSIYAAAAAAGETGSENSCVASAGVGNGSASDGFDLVWDVGTTVRLYFPHEQALGVNDAASALSSITLSRNGGGTVFTRTISLGSGSNLDGGTLETVLEPGRYTLHVEQSVEAAGAAPGNVTSGSGESRAICFVSLTPYACASINAQPADANTCTGGQTSFNVDVSGTAPTLQWQWRPDSNATWTDVVEGFNNGPSGLPWFNASGATRSSLIETADAGDLAPSWQQRCVVTDLCGTKTSDVVTLTVCRGDYDCDGFVTGDDFDAFVAAFENGGDAADFNGDGFVNGDDFDGFVVAFEAGC